MKGIEVEMDGIKYFVKVTTKKIYDEFILIELFINTFNSKCIYWEHDYVNPELSFNKKMAKKFILRSFENDSKKK